MVRRSVCSRGVQRASNNLNALNSHTVMLDTVGIINRHHETVHGFKCPRALLVHGLLLV